MNSNIDLERIKRIPIADLIAQSNLTVIGSGHTLTTAEHDSLKIFTNSNSWTWYSQSGKAGKALGGSTIDWWMAVNKCTRGEAIRALAAMVDGGTVPLQSVSHQSVTKPAPQWQSAQWQTEARAELESSQYALWFNADGEIGREYLAQRGIALDTAIGWGLGVELRFDPIAKQRFPAIIVPYMNRSISALQYRFIGVGKDDKGRLRFSQKSGGQRFLCGLQVASSTETLFIVEGELNAISISQIAAQCDIPADAVSFGTQTNIELASNVMATVAKKYKRIIVWADEPEFAIAAMKSINHSRVYPVRTVVSDGTKFDANHLLQSDGLETVIRRLLEKYD